MSSIGSLASGLLQSILPSSLLTNNTTAANLVGTASSSVTQQPDTGQLSTFAQLVSTLQQLQQSNPAQYQQVTQQIATNLQSAAQTAQSNGNTAAATQLNQLAADFTNASTSGQLPNLEDLATAVGGHHGHHHSEAGGSGGASTGSGGASTGSGGASTGSGGASTGNLTGALSQLLSSLQSGLQSSGTTNGSLNATEIIQNTLASAGINT